MQKGPKKGRDQALPNHLHSTLEAMWYSFDSLLPAGWDQGAFQGEKDHTIRQAIQGLLPEEGLGSDHLGLHECRGAEGAPTPDAC